MAFGDFTVVRASTKLRIGSNGLYGSVANNVPAFEFNTDGTYRGLLVEPGATNLALHSQDFTQGTWAKTNATVTANTGVAPDGTTTADRITATSGLGQVQYSFTASAGVTYTASFFIRRITGTGTVNIRSVENVNTPVVITSSWARYSVTATSTTTTIRIGVSLATSGDEIEVWQGQLETGSVATSPIVTTGSTAARVADVISLTSASSLIGQTEGTLYAEVTTRLTGGTVGKIIAECRTDANNRFRILKSSADAFQVIVTTGGVDQVSITSSTNQSGVFKVAFAYKENDFALYVNGVQIGTDVSGTVPTTNRIDIGATGAGGNQFTDNVRSVALFPTRLANATLASLTA